jgi:hypothetical protein
MKKIFVFVMAFTLLFTSMAFGAGREFTDVTEKDWFYEELNSVVEKGIVDGYPDGSFKPGNSLKFEEFVKMVVVAVSDEDIGVSDGLLWYKNYINAALENDYITELMLLNIGRNIDRKTMTEILYRIVVDTEGVESYSEYEIKFLASKLSDLTVKDTKTLTIAGMGIICGYPDGTFKPGNSLTRAETVTVICRLIDKGMRLPAEIEEEILPVALEDLTKVDLSRLYDYPTATGKSIEDENEYYYTHGSSEGYYVDLIPEDYVRFMGLMHNRDYRTMNSGVRRYKDSLNYYLNGRKEYRDVRYEQLRSYHLAYDNSPELLEYITNTRTFIEDFLDIWVQDTIDNKVQVQSEFYTNGNLIHTTDDYRTAIRGVLRIRYDSHENPKNIKEELDLVKRNGQKDYSIYMNFNDIPDLEIGKWYDIAMDVVTSNSSVTHGLDSIAIFNYNFVYPISINEVE